MDIADIRNMSTVVDEIPESSNGVHESILRSYHILEKTKYYLSQGVPAKIVLELIAEMERNRNDTQW